jgi:hypothetical protein
MGIPACADGDTECRHEPWPALDGGDGNGIAAIHEVVACGARMLCCGGVLLLEVLHISFLDFMHFTFLPGRETKLA